MAAEPTSTSVAEANDTEPSKLEAASQRLGKRKDRLQKGPYGYAWGALFGVAGIVVLWFSLTAIRTGMIKPFLVAAGAVLLFLCVDRLGKARFGFRNFDTGYVLSTVWLICITFSAIFADLLPLGIHNDPKLTLAIPGNQTPDLFSGNPLGTNNFSLDIFARSIYGARVSLATAFIAVAIGICLGGTIGLCAGYFRGWFDGGIGILTNSMLAFPPLLLLIAIATALGRPDAWTEAIWKSAIGLAIVGTPTMLRLSRANTLVYAQREFVMAARSMGAKNRRIIFRELAPNVLLPMLSYAFIVAAALIVAEGSLSFLGLGLKPPEPTWGNMIAEGRPEVLKKYPHIPLIPGLFMFLTVFSFNRVGEKLRAKWDAREAKV